MPELAIKFEISRKQQREIVANFLSNATPEEVTWMLKSLTTQQRNTLNHMDVIRRYSQIVANACCLPKGALSDHVKPF